MAPSRRKVLKSLTAAAGIGTFAGCAGDDGSSNNGNTQTTTESNSGSNNGSNSDTYKIGMVLPFSGAVADIGTKGEIGADIAINNINDQGGVNGRNLELLTRDSEGSPETAVSRARDLLNNENVDVLIGGGPSSVGKAVAKFTASENVPFVVNTSKTLDLIREQCARTTIKTSSTVYHQAASAAELVAGTISNDIDGPVKISGLEPDYVYGHQSWELFKELLDEKDVEVEYGNVYYPAFQAGDYQSEIQSILGEEPDVVHTSLYAGDQISFIRQAKQYGFFDQTTLMGGSEPIGVSQPLGADMVEKWDYTSYYFGFDNEMNNQFVKEYRDRTGEYPVLYAGEAQSAIKAIEAGLKESGGFSTDDLIAGVEGAEFETVRGKMTIREDDHQAITENMFAGKLGPVDFADIYAYSQLVKMPPEVTTPPAQCNNF